MEVFFEIIKIIVPAMIVGVTAYMLIKQFTESQINLQNLKNHRETQTDMVRIKLQAYERLSLFCERISIPSLLMRLRMKHMSNQDLKNALYIAIQKEYEHNMVQQIYVSDKLWQIISVAKENVLKMIDLEYSKSHPEENAETLADALYKRAQGAESDPMGHAQAAIKKETSLLF